ncbi:hypothetical protein SEA_GREENWEASEL_54 [Streptomyces phage GreenWeasel]|nr:hypothetical protein SEA_GREENWEASEL_54 [Streptomyces phage GreenWeasel]
MHESGTVDVRLVEPSRKIVLPLALDTCRHLTAKLVTLGGVETGTWVYGYPCGQPVAGPAAQACAEHLVPSPRLG